MGDLIKGVCVAIGTALGKMVGDAIAGKDKK